MLAGWSVCALLGIFVDPVDHGSSTVAVDREHCIDIRPDRHRWSTPDPLQRDRTVAESRSFGDDTDSADAGQVFVAHQGEPPRHLVVSGRTATPESTTRS